MEIAIKFKVIRAKVIGEIAILWMMINKNKNNKYRNRGNFLRGFIRLNYLLFNTISKNSD